MSKEEPFEIYIYEDDYESFRESDDEPKLVAMKNHQPKLTGKGNRDAQRNLLMMVHIRNQCR